MNSSLLTTQATAAEGKTPNLFFFENPENPSRRTVKVPR